MSSISPAQKKLDEKNSKIISRLKQEVANKTCFDCQEKGPVYVCLNYGIFVCMTCSGIHREMQHRVKSISMASFTPQEMELLQKMGNARARQIWLNKWKDSDYPQPRPNDLPKIREFMRKKYEKKLWYREPKEGEEDSEAVEESPMTNKKASTVKVVPSPARAAAKQPEPETDLMGDFASVSISPAHAAAAPAPAGGLSDVDDLFFGAATPAQPSAPHPAAVAAPVQPAAQPEPAPQPVDTAKRNKEDIMSLFAPPPIAQQPPPSGGIAGGFGDVGAFSAAPTNFAHQSPVAQMDPWAAMRSAVNPPAPQSAVGAGLTPAQQQAMLLFQQQQQQAAYMAFMKQQHALQMQQRQRPGAGLMAPAAVPQAQAAFRPAAVPVQPTVTSTPPKKNEPDFFDSLSPFHQPSAPSAPLPAAKPASAAGGSGWSAFSSSAPASGGGDIGFDPFA